MIKRIIGFICISLLSVLLLAGSAGANLLTNGSFEDGVNPPVSSWKGLSAGNSDLTGWTIGGGGVDWENDMTPHDGLFIDLNSGLTPGTISQNFNAVVGQWYTLEFDLAGPGTWSPFTDPREVKVTLDGIEYIFSVAASSNSNLFWEEKSLNFQANATSMELTFASLAAGNVTGGELYWGPVIDDVSVDRDSASVPEPFSILLLGLGILGITGFKRTIKE
jgi:choice-of-anchor C domain-containing protein